MKQTVLWIETSGSCLLKKNRQKNVTDSRLKLTGIEIPQKNNENDPRSTFQFRKLGEALLNDLIGYYSFFFRILYSRFDFFFSFGKSLLNAASDRIRYPIDLITSSTDMTGNL